MAAEANNKLNLSSVHAALKYNLLIFPKYVAKSAINKGPVGGASETIGKEKAQLMEMSQVTVAPGHSWPG